MESTIYERLKEAAVLGVTTFICILAPIHNAIIALMLFFSINIVTGFQADKAVHRAEFSLRKAFDAIRLLTLYYASLLAMHITLELFHEAELARALTKWVTLIVCYFYLLNIARNACLVFPRSKSLRFFYSLLKVEVFDLIRRRLGIFLEVDTSIPPADEPKDETETPHTNP